MSSLDAYGSEDSDDDWFYESFKRYDDLLMYDVQGCISSATLLNTSRLLLAASGGRCHEVWELSIPKKLIAGRDSGLTRDRDFSVITAGYTTDPVKRMLPLDSGIVTSESSGVKYYSIPNGSDQTDIITLKQTLRSDTKDAPLAVAGSDVFSGTTISNIINSDLESNSTYCLPLQSSNIESIYKGASSKAISELAYTCGNLYVCLMDRGNVLIYDPKQNCITHNVAPSDSSSGMWTMDVSNNGSLIATVNSNGVLRVYDNRNLTEPFFTNDLEVPNDCKTQCYYHLCVQISPKDSVVSVSGFHKNIQVFDFKRSEKDKSIFTHDGHRGEDVQNVVTHLWHPSQDKLIFSADDTGHLQAWRFKVT